MKLEHLKAFESAPEDEPRSRLEPYRELILRWRRQGRTIRRIAKLLSDQLHVPIKKSALHQFVQLRSKPRRLIPEPETAQHPLMPTAPQPAATGKRTTPEERAAQVAYIRSLNKPAVAEEKPTLLFNFDPDKPRTNQPKKEETNGNSSN